eukprot:ctg_1262.g587
MSGTLSAFQCGNGGMNSPNVVGTRAGSLPRRHAAAGRQRRPTENSAVGRTADRDARCASGSRHRVDCLEVLDEKARRVQGSARVASSFAGFVFGGYDGSGPGECPPVVGARVVLGAVGLHSPRACATGCRSRRRGRISRRSGWWCRGPSRPAVRGTVRCGRRSGRAPRHLAIPLALVAVVAGDARVDVKVAGDGHGAVALVVGDAAQDKVTHLLRLLQARVRVQRLWLVAGAITGLHVGGEHVQKRGSMAGVLFACGQEDARIQHALAHERVHGAAHHMPIVPVIAGDDGVAAENAHPAVDNPRWIHPQIARQVRGEHRTSPAGRPRRNWPGAAAAASAADPFGRCRAGRPRPAGAQTRCT